MVSVGVGVGVGGVGVGGDGGGGGGGSGVVATMAAVAGGCGGGGDGGKILCNVQVWILARKPQLLAHQLHLLSATFELLLDMLLDVNGGATHEGLGTWHLQRFSLWV